MTEGSSTRSILRIIYYGLVDTKASPPASLAPDVVLEIYFKLHACTFAPYFDRLLLPASFDTHSTGETFLQI